MRALIIGSGKIGCGYLVPAFAGAGWQVVLAGRDPAVVSRIGRVGGLRARTTGDPGAVQHVRGLQAVVTGDAGFERAARDADVICAAVGVGAVADLAEPLARALAGRGAPVDVYVVENDDCAPALREAILRVAAAEGLELPPLGVAGAVATVAVGRGSWRDGSGAPTFVGDDARTLLVDATAVVTPVVAVPGIRGTRQYRARLLEKLYGFNTGHALCGYLGWLRGHDDVARAIADPLIRPIVVGCLLESRQALLAAHPGLGEDVHGPVAEALRRFGDAELADPLVRVARDPLRKLRPGDRLLGPTDLVRRATGEIPAHFALGIASALLFRPDDDEQARELRGRLSRWGVMATLADVCDLGGDPELAEAVASRYRGFVFTDEGTLFPPVHGLDGPQAQRLAEPAHAVEVAA